MARALLPQTLINTNIGFTPREYTGSLRRLQI